MSGTPGRICLRSALNAAASSERPPLRRKFVSIKLPQSVFCLAPPVPHETPASRRLSSPLPQCNQRRFLCCRTRFVVCLAHFPCATHRRVLAQLAEALGVRVLRAHVGSGRQPRRAATAVAQLGRPRARRPAVAGGVQLRDLAGGV
jgi:hypothetical protein